MVEPVQTLAKTFTHMNILTVKVGTNTPQGGDAGHGGKTVFELTDEGGTAWKVEVLDESGRARSYPYNFKRIRLELYGDAEAETFLKALDFAVKVLRLQRGEL